MSKNRKSGFTLIELLVVIAIIGILSSVVLASLNTARAKGSDATIKSDLSSIQTEAAIYFDSNGQSYGTAANCSSGMFTGDNTIKNAIAGIVNQGATTTCSSTAAGFVVYAPTLKSVSTPWCVDGSGNATTGIAQVGSTTPSCI